ncbi:MAG TPA: hypothetical protein VFZ78_02290, partial [Flavisolibacter sp.]
GINYSTLKLPDLQTGTYSSRKTFEKFKMLSRMTAANRYPASSTAVTTSSTSTSAVSGNLVKNIRYTISRTQPTAVSDTKGSPTTQAFNSGAIVCSTTPTTMFEQISSLLIGGMLDPNATVLQPGKLFRVTDVVNGVFAPQSVSRKPGFFTINIQNQSGQVSVPVGNMNDNTQVLNAINTLRNQASSSLVNTDFTYASFEFESSSQFALQYNVNAGVNLAALIEIPATVANNTEFSLSAQNSLNMAMVHVLQPMYTISVGGEGPQSTIQGTIPSDLLCVSDVIYGRMAFFYTVTSLSQVEAKAAIENIISVGLDESLSLADAQTKLSTNAKLVLSTSGVFARVIGGSATNAVKVTSLSGIRQYIAELEPTVGAANAYPLSFNLRFADNSPAFMTGVTSYSDKECIRAKQLKVTLHEIRPTKVFDFGDEEIFGSVTVSNIGTRIDGNAALWSKGSSEWVTGKQNIPITGVGTPHVLFNLPITLPTGVTFTINVRDRIMSDAEILGANETDKSRGYAQYSPSSQLSVPFSDILNAGGTLTKVFTVAENNAEAQVKITFQLITQPIQ